jgi:pimeloyl-ACP methyl ester carboxylesterase
VPEIVVDGQKLNYQVHVGAMRPAHPPLLLIHGAGGNLMHWPGQLRRLAHSVVYALDLPGHGQSRGPGRESIEAYAECVEHFANALELPPFVCAGHSMGGAITLELALRTGPRLSGQILVSTGARLPVSAALLDGIHTNFVEATELLSSLAHQDEIDPALKALFLRRLRQTPPEVLEADFVACTLFDRTEELRNIQVPALVMCGSADRLTPLKLSEQLARDLPRARLAIVPDAGHMAMLEPESIPQIVREIREWQACS